MNKILKLISSGAITVADSYVTSREYVTLPRNGFRQDNVKLRNDVTRVGSDLGNVISRYEKQPNKSPSGK